MLTKKIFIFLLSVFVIASCTKEESIQTDKLIIDDLSSESFTNPELRSGNNSTVEIVEKPGEEFIVVSGAFSKLKRKANGINVHFKTNGLTPGNAYTLWWVIFGDAPGPPILVTHAGGLVVNSSGKGNFIVDLSVGEVFNNPLTAEVHMALRTHGPVQPEMMPAQIETIDGGCTSGFPSGPALYPDSDIVGYCANIQVAMHPAN